MGPTTFVRRLGQSFVNMQNRWGLVQLLASNRHSSPSMTTTSSRGRDGKEEDGLDGDNPGRRGWS